MLCALEIPPVIDIGSRKEISLCKWGGLQHGAERLIWELKGDALDGIEATVDHEPGGVEVAGLCGRQILQIEVTKLIEPSLAVFPFKAIQGEDGSKEAVLQEQLMGTLQTLHTDEVCRFSEQSGVVSEGKEKGSPPALRFAIVGGVYHPPFNGIACFIEAPQDDGKVTPFLPCRRFDESVYVFQKDIARPVCP